MNQQPDKFFRDKLDRYQRPAPAGAWNKIEAGLAKKNNKPVPWLAIAASLLLLAAATFLFWPEKKNTGQPAPLATDQKNVPSHTPAGKNAEPESSTAVVKPKTLDEQASIAPYKPAPKKTEMKKQEAPAEDVMVADAGAEERMVTTSKEPSKIQKPSTEQPVAANVTPSTEQPENKNIKLVFSAAESEAYLDKKSLAEATSSEKKSSTLKKLLKKAEDLKTNQDPFGELRQKKNEILALNFRTDKQRGQNK
jgi:hypothetical protein